MRRAFPSVRAISGPTIASPGPAIVIVRALYPIRHDHYGSPDGYRFAHVANTHMLEVPIATARLFRTNWPAGGGGYFRLMPYVGLALADPTREFKRRGSGDFLFPPLGTRSRAAPRQGA